MESSVTSAAGETAEGSASADVFEAAENPDDWPVVSVQVTSSSPMPDEQLIEDAMNEYLISINAGVKVDAIQIAFGDLATADDVNAFQIIRSPWICSTGEPILPWMAV